MLPQRNITTVREAMQVISTPSDNPFRLLLGMPKDELISAGCGIGLGVAVIGVMVLLANVCA